MKLFGPCRGAARCRRYIWFAIFLQFQSLKRVIGIVTGSWENWYNTVVFGSGLNNAFKSFLVFAGKAVSGAFGRRSLKIIHVSGFFLDFNHAGADMIQELFGKSLSPLVGNIVFVIGEVSDHFIDTVDAECREVVTERSQIAFGEREQTVVNQALDNLAFDFQRSTGQFQQLVNPGKQAMFIALINIAEARAVNGNDPDRTGLLWQNEPSRCLWPKVRAGQAANGNTWSESGRVSKPS